MIWSNDRIKLFNADCFDIFPQIADKSVDLILADLPYGTTACKWDSVLPLDSLWQAYERIIKDNGAIVLTASQPFTSALIMNRINIFRYQWIWVKSRKTGFLNSKNKPLSQHEDVLVFSKAITAAGHKNLMKYNPQNLIKCNKTRHGDKNKCEADDKGHKYYRKSQSKEYLQEFTNYPTSVLNINNESKPIHPTQKPVALMEYLIKTYTNENDLVLDNTFGSGTTAVACQNLNRQFVGMEKEKKYFDIAVQRLTA